MALAFLFEICKLLSLIFQIFTEQTIVSRLAVAVTTGTAVRMCTLLARPVFIEIAILRGPMNILGTGVPLHTEARLETPG